MTDSSLAPLDTLEHRIPTWGRASTHVPAGVLRRGPHLHSPLRAILLPAAGPNQVGSGPSSTQNPPTAPLTQRKGQRCACGKANSSLTRPPGPGDRQVAASTETDEQAVTQPSHHGTPFGTKTGARVRHARQCGWTSSTLHGTNEARHQRLPTVCLHVHRVLECDALSGARNPTPGHWAVAGGGETTKGQNSANPSFRPCTLLPASHA